jgi:hypothetical protein
MDVGEEEEEAETGAGEGRHDCWDTKLPWGMGAKDEPLEEGREEEIRLTCAF